MRTLIPAILLAPATLLCGCGPSQPNKIERVTLPDVPKTSVVNDIVPATITKGAKARLIAAAEPFETLTESAFDPSSAKVDAGVTKAQATAARIRPFLPPDARAALAKQMAALDTAHRDDQRADLAQASIEIYRILVTEGAGASRVPAAVSLLDYTGFRYTADLKANPVRWSDMAAAADFAKTKWATVAPRVTDRATADQFAAALDNMAESAAIKDPQRASASAAAELDLVDVLERLFNQA